MQFVHKLISGKSGRLKTLLNILLVDSNIFANGFVNHLINGAKYLLSQFSPYSLQVNDIVCANELFFIL